LYRFAIETISPGFNGRHLRFDQAARYGDFDDEIT
jgi:hypothetical protein